MFLPRSAALISGLSNSKSPIPPVNTTQNRKTNQRTPVTQGRAGSFSTHAVSVKSLWLVLYPPQFGHCTCTDIETSVSHFFPDLAPFSAPSRNGMQPEVRSTKLRSRVDVWFVIFVFRVLCPTSRVRGQALRVAALLKRPSIVLLVPRMTADRALPTGQASVPRQLAHVRKQLVAQPLHASPPVPA